MKPQFTQTYGTSVESAAGLYQYGSELPKPCLHPLLTRSGTVLSGFEPSDHVWHRGLWFTIKFVNDVNFWEEHAPFGVQRPDEPQCRWTPDGTLSISQNLSWTSEPGGPAITEQRSLLFHPQTGSTRTLTWQSSLYAMKDLRLDRTPFTTWGGYGGLSFRATRELHDVTFTIPDGATVPQLLGVPQRYISMHGKLDGGPGRSASIACFDHPANPRYPVSWYAKSSGGFTFFNAAFLFNEPMQLKAGQSLDFRYRLAWRDGTFDPSELADLASHFDADQGVPA